MTRAVRARLRLAAAVLWAAFSWGCGGKEEKDMTPVEWLKENTIILDQLRSYDKRELHQGINRFLQLGRERGTDVVNYILNDPNLEDYRIEVVLARILAEWKDPRAIPKLLVNLKERDAGAASIAKEGLCLFGDHPQVIEAMRETIADPDVNNRLAAAEILSEMKGPAATSLLMDLFKAEEEVDIRGICLIGIINCRDPRRTEILVGALADGDLGIRQQAWDALVLKKPPVRFDPAGDPVVRLQAIKELRRWIETSSRKKDPKAGS